MLLARATLVTLVALTALVAATSASALSRPETIRLLSVSASEDEVGIPPGGFSAGDAFVFTDHLYRWAGRKRGARVGRIEGQCTFNRVDPGPPEVATAYCVATGFLPAGQVVVAKHFRFAEDSPPVSTVAVRRRHGSLQQRSGSRHPSRPPRR